MVGISCERGPQTAAGLLLDPDLRRAVRRVARATETPLSVCRTVAELPSSSPFLLVESDALGLEELALLSRTAGKNTQIAILGRPSTLDASLDQLEASSANHLMMDAGFLDETELLVTLLKVKSGDIFGLDKYVPSGAAIHPVAVPDAATKAKVLVELGNTAREFGARSSMATRIQNTADELLMNALNDAPRVAGVKGTKVKEALLRTASDGRYFALSVTDHYGLLERRIVLETLRSVRNRCGAPNLNGSSAGLGLYMVLSSCSRFIVNLDPGVRSEVICLFDLRHKHGHHGQFARSMHFFVK